MQSKQLEAVRKKFRKRRKETFHVPHCSFSLSGTGNSGKKTFNLDKRWKCSHGRTILISRNGLLWLNGDRKLLELPKIFNKSWGESLKHVVWKQCRIEKKFFFPVLLPIHAKFSIMWLDHTPGFWSCSAPADGSSHVIHPIFIFWIFSMTFFCISSYFTLKLDHEPLVSFCASLCTASSLSTSPCSHQGLG